MFRGFQPGKRFGAMKATISEWISHPAQQASASKSRGRRRRRTAFHEAVQALESRQLLSAGLLVESPSQSDSTGTSQIAVADLGPLSVQDTQFDITTFDFTLPTALEQTRTFDMDGLRFYGGADMVVQQNTVAFGTADAPTWVSSG